MDARSRLMLATVLLISLLILLTSDSVLGYGTLLDEDEKRVVYSRGLVQLSRIPDEVATADFYQLDLYVENLLYVERLLPNYDWAGPVSVSIDFYLPSYAEDVRVLLGPESSSSTLQRMQVSVRPDVEDSGNFSLARCSISNAPNGIARKWLFLDYVHFSVEFEVPENGSATAYTYIQTVFYSYDGLFYSRFADERIYWLYVESSKANVAPPQVINAEASMFLLDPLGVDAIFATVLTSASVLCYMRRRRRGLQQLDTTSPKAVEATPTKTSNVPTGVALLVVLNLLIGLLGVLSGLSGVYRDPSSAFNSIVFGVVLIITAFGLLRLKTWGWYASVIVSVISIVDHYVLFPSSTLMIPLELPVLVYLYIRRDVFRI